jgi:hypothetical protein
VALQSPLFRGDPRLEACAVSDPAHVTPGTRGSFVGKIQLALIQCGNAVISPGEISTETYGPTTTAAVRRYKTQRNILNYMGQIDDIVGKKTIASLDSDLMKLPPSPIPPGPLPFPPLPPIPPIPPIPPVPVGPPHEFIVHDVRLFGWKPAGDVLEVNGDTPLDWVLHNINVRGKPLGGNMIVKFMAHGLPGFVQFARGRFQHPTLATNVVDPDKGGLHIGPGKSGICRTDLTDFQKIKGSLKRLEFHSCLVSRIGPCHEANGHISYDGNEFCFRLAQNIGAEVRASAHLQYYWPDNGHQNMDFAEWNGLVTTWGPMGNILTTQMFPFHDKGKVSAPER